MTSLQSLYIYSTHLQRNWARVVNVSRRRSPGGVITSQTTLCRNFGGKEGGGGGGGGGVLSKGAY